jgi:hypothetical protein
VYASFQNKEGHAAMTDVTAQELRDAASVAHRRGDTEQAIGLFERLVSLYPNTPEAVEAVFYLSSIGKGRRRRPAKRAEE